MSVWPLALATLLSWSAAALSCLAAARLWRDLLVLAELRRRLTAQELETDKLLSQQKRLAQRQNLTDYREREQETLNPKRNRTASAVPNWRDDPQGFIAHHENQLRGNRNVSRSTPE